jgi:hypothetical protein
VQTVTSTATLYTTETRIQCIQGSHKTMPFTNRPTTLCRRSLYLPKLSRRLALLHRLCQLSTKDRPTYQSLTTLNQLNPLLVYSLPINNRLMLHKPTQHSQCQIPPSNQRNQHARGAELCSRGRRSMQTVSRSAAFYSILSLVKTQNTSSVL